MTGEEKKPSLLEFLFLQLGTLTNTAIARELVPEPIAEVRELVPEPIAEVREFFPHLSRIEISNPSNSGHRS